MNLQDKSFKSFIWWKFRATYSSVALIETEDPKRTPETLNFFGLRSILPWKHDFTEFWLHNINEKLQEKDRADRNRILNRALADERLKGISKDSLENLLEILKTGKYISQTGPDMYEITKKKLHPTQILHYDVWNGLMVNLRRPNEVKKEKLTKNEDQSTEKEEIEWERWEQPEEKDEKKDPFASVFQNDQNQPDRMELTTALEIIDAEIRKERTVAILTGIIPSIMGEKQKELRKLTEAVNNWAHDIQVQNQKSLVVIITPNRNILPQTTLNNVIFTRPQPSTAAEREIIIRILAENYNITPNITKLIKALAGLNLHQCETVLLESFFQTRQFKTEFISTLKQEQVEKQGILQILNPGYGFERIGGYDSVKKYIQEGIIDIFQNPDLANDLHLEPLRSVLLFGIPGSGKSLLAEALAFETNLPLFHFQPSSVFDKYVGETERKTRTAIEMMEANAPCIILIEEADALGHRSNTDADSGTSRRVFGQMLDYTGRQERKAIIVGTTNRPEFLDAAFLREGRFTPVPMLLPNQYARRAIFGVHLYEKRKLKTKFMEGPQDPLMVFAKRMKGATGAEIEGAIEGAQRIAFRERRNYITDDDVLSAIEDYNINFNERIRVQKEYIEQAERICRNKEFLRELRQEQERIE
ncbi:MAG: hypothetical protein AYK18_17180 [Theionarchaea archaeon DG-70]|nr:MAG: hypothetical protein AYK18_17180 [Theionarchaea archaeon DG-70]